MLLCSCKYLRLGFESLDIWSNFLCWNLRFSHQWNNACPYSKIGSYFMIEKWGTLSFCTNQAFPSVEITTLKQVHCCCTLCLCVLNFQEFLLFWSFRTVWHDTVFGVLALAVLRFYEIFKCKLTEWWVTGFVESFWEKREFLVFVVFILWESSYCCEASCYWISCSYYCYCYYVIVTKAYCLHCQHSLLTKKIKPIWIYWSKR